MAETHRDYTALGAAMRTDWTAERAAAVKAHVEQRRIRRRRRNAVAVASALLGVGVVSALVLSRPSTTRKAATGTLPPPLPVTTAERSAPTAETPPAEPRAVALTPGTRFSVEEGVSSRTFKLTEGKVRFESGKGGEQEKKLSVRVGVLVIDDIGTVFTVETVEEDRARVDVIEGLVRVAWPDGSAVIAAGQGGVFPPREPAEDEPKGTRTISSSSVDDTVIDWRVSARQGQYKDAYRIIQASPDEVGNRVEDLMLAADVMRLTGHPKLAVGYLEQVITGHFKDPRASLAAFTLGRVFLNELGQPRQAATSFAKAGRGNSPLSEEALAREVEAWSRAGEVDKAKTAAKRYQTKYPNGPRIDVVRAFGGLNAL